MKRIILCHLIICTLFPLSRDASAQVPDWLWARSAGGSDNEYVNSVAVDGSGNIYVTGFFEGASVIFGSTTLNNAGPAGTPDVFLVKYDSTGNVLWAKSGGGNYFDKSYAVAADAGGNVYVTGFFYSSTITFGSATLSNATSGSNIFIVKYNSSGNVMWARSAGGNDVDVAYGVAADANGNVYVTGYIGSTTATFGTVTVNNAGYPYSDIFIVRYDSTGVVRWAKAAGDVYPDIGTGVAVDLNGNIFLTGYFISNSVTFGSTTLVENGGSNAFLVKYDTAGVVLWAKTTGGFSYDVANAVATDASGNVYITGYFDGSPLTFSTISLSDSGQSDLFVAGYSSTGTVLWAQQAGGSNIDEGKSIATGPGGNVYVTGHFFSPSISFGNYTFNNDGNNDIFIARYDAGGNPLGARKAGGSAIESGQGVAADINANVYVAGTFNSSSITFGATTLTNAGANDMFLGRIDSAIVGVNEIGSENILSIFPNPVTGELRIRYPEFRIEGIEIYDVLGKIRQISNVGRPTTKNQISIDVSKLSPGIYFVKVRTERGEWAARFVKL